MVPRIKVVLGILAVLALILALSVPALAAQVDGNLGGLGNDLLGGLGNGWDGNGNGWDGNGNWGNGWDGNGNWGNGGGGIVQAPTETFVSGTNQNTGGAVNSTGDNSNTCAAQQNFNNSGGVLNQQSFQQYASQSGGIVALGPTFTNNPQQSVPCEQTVQQSASSSSY